MKRIFYNIVVVVIAVFAMSVAMFGVAATGYETKEETSVVNYIDIIPTTEEEKRSS